jgi:hypothetical protein
MNTREKKITTLEELLEKVKERNKGEKGEKKTLADIYGKLKRGFDGLEYQKTARYGEWD